MSAGARAEMPPIMVRLPVASPEAGGAFLEGEPMRRPNGPTGLPCRGWGFRPRPAMLLVCLLALLLTSCSELQGALKTQQALSAAGFASANVNVHRDLGSG